MRPLDGLFILRLDLPQPHQQPPGTTTSSATSKEKKEVQESQQQQQQKQKTSPAAFLNSCRLLCRLQFDGSKAGSVSGDVKLLVANNNNNNDIDKNKNNNNNTTRYHSSVRARISPDSTWILGSESSSAAQDASSSYRDIRAFYLNNGFDTEQIISIDFGVTLDHLDGVLLQVANSLSKEINDSNNTTAASKETPANQKNAKKIYLRFTGTVSLGQGVGKAQVSTSATSHPDKHISVINNKTENGSIVTQELRMIMHEVPTSECCSNCYEPLNLRDPNLSSSSSSSSSPITLSTNQQKKNQQSSNSSGIPHPSVPECLVYCSENCKKEHDQVANILVPHLAPYSTKKAGRCVANFANVEYNVFWRSVTATTFLILVEPRNIFGFCYEILLDLFIDARQGMKINMINTKLKNQKQKQEQQQLQDPTSNMINLNISVYEAVIRSALRNGCVALASCCLNQLHVWCDQSSYLERIFVNFWDFTIGGGWDGLRLISTLGEYIMIVRPMYECATILIESALKSTLPNDFWLLLANAKGLLIAMYNINGSISFTPAVQHLRATIVPEQQRETLLMLAKVFLLMAARLPEEYAQKMLLRAEECYTDAIEEDRLRQNLRRMALTTLNMSALCSLIKGGEVKGQQLRAQGLALLQNVAASPTLHRQQQQHCVSTIISTIGTSDELGAGVVEK